MLYLCNHNTTQMILVLITQIRIWACNIQGSCEQEYKCEQYNWIQQGSFTLSTLEAEPENTLTPWSELCLRILQPQGSHWFRGPAWTWESSGKCWAAAVGSREEEKLRKECNSLLRQEHLQVTCKMHLVWAWCAYGMGVATRWSLRSPLSHSMIHSDLFYDSVIWWQETITFSASCVPFPWHFCFLFYFVMLVMFFQVASIAFLFLLISLFVA